MKYKRAVMDLSDKGNNISGKSLILAAKYKKRYDNRRLKKLYITHTGHEPEAIDELPSSGSNRRYFRLKGTPTLIGVSGESVEENRAFLYMAEHFRGKGLPVPEVFIRSEDNIYICRKI